jgi:hypothetical protein
MLVSIITSSAYDDQISLKTKRLTLNSTNGFPKYGDAMFATQPAIIVEPMAAFRTSVG